MFELYDIVKLKKDREDIGVKSTYEGTIIDYVQPDDVYSVEFYDDNGDTIDESIYAYFSPNELILVKRFTDVQQ